MTGQNSMRYIQLDTAEQEYGTKHLLYAEMGLLNSMKHYQEYKKLRKIEITLKLDLKKHIAEVSELLASLEKILPKVKVKTPEVEQAESTLYSKKRRDLEWEIEEIKRKISTLS